MLYIDWQSPDNYKRRIEFVSVYTINLNIAVFDIAIEVFRCPISKFCLISDAILETVSK